MGIIPNLSLLPTALFCISMTAIGASMDRALELLNEGKRDLLVSAIPDAVTNFSKCCEMLVSLKGEMGAECAEAYFYYGKALLELSRVESGVLGNALDGVNMDAETSPTKGVIVEDADGLPTEDKMETDTEKTEEPGNLEQAWQMFDLAKVIYGKTKNLTKECESLILLGEVSLENSNFKQAVEDLTTCLARRCAGMPADSRSIAETHFQLGVAQAHSGDYVSAEKSLRAAISVLNARISNLKKMEVSENITKELSDLETLIYEIKERTSDHKEMQRGTYKEDKDFVPMYNDVEEIVTRKFTITA